MKGITFSVSIFNLDITPVCKVTIQFYPSHKAKTTPFMRRNSNYYFVDQYNAEFNRSIEPMKGGYTDNYYMQMAENIRRYKGVRPILVLKGLTRIKLNGDFTDWSNVKVEYRDTKGDTFHRDYNGYGGLHYIDTLGRNDIITCKVAVDNNNVYFYAETNEALTPINMKADLVRLAYFCPMRDYHLQENILII